VQRDSGRVEHAFARESEANMVLESLLSAAERGEMRAQESQESVEVLRSLSVQASLITESMLRRDRLLLEGLERLQPSFLVPLHFDGAPVVTDLTLRLRAAKSSTSSHGGLKRAVFVGWRYFRAFAPPADPAFDLEPDLMVSMMPLLPSKLGSGVDNAFHAVSAKASSAAPPSAHSFLAAVNAPEFAHARPSLACRVFVSTSRLPTVAEHDWMSRLESSEVVLAHMRATAAGLRRQPSDAGPDSLHLDASAPQARCVHMRPSDPPYIHRSSSSLPGAAADSSRVYYVGVRAVLHLSLPLPPGVPLPPSLSLGIQATGSAFIDPLRRAERRDRIDAAGHAMPFDTVDTLLARLQEQVRHT
jgi:hypothetical protein